jgi:hypothetical protein
MTLNSGSSAPPNRDQGRCESLSVRPTAFRSEHAESGQDAGFVNLQNWNGAPLYKHLFLAVIFLVAFLLLDRSSTASQSWDGAANLVFAGRTGYRAAALWRNALFALVVRCRGSQLPSANYFLVRRSRSDDYIGGITILRGRGESIPD